LNGAALLHGKEVMGRKINVSFTKSKLCWESSAFAQVLWLSKQNKQ
jgi:hypothetical protein